MSVPAMFALALLLGLGACSECQKDFDCPGTKVCNVSQGTCEAFECKGDRDCPPTTACKNNRCKGRSAPHGSTSPDAFLLSPAGATGPITAPVSGPTDAGVVTPPG